MVRSIVAFILLVAVPASGQTPARDAIPGAKKGTSVIRGRITAGDTGKPLRRARVTLTAPERSGVSRDAPPLRAEAHARRGRHPNRLAAGDQALDSRVQIGVAALNQHKGYQ